MDYSGQKPPYTREEVQKMLNGRATGSWRQQLQKYRAYYSARPTSVQPTPGLPATSELEEKVEESEEK
jgi:hypothetical protein